MKRTDLSHVEIQDTSSYYWGSFRGSSFTVDVIQISSGCRSPDLHLSRAGVLLRAAHAQSSPLLNFWQISHPITFSPHAPDTLKKLNCVSHCSRVKIKTQRVVCVSVRLSALASAGAAVTPAEQFWPPNCSNCTTALVQMWRTWCFRGRKVAGSIPIVHSSLTGDSDLWVLITVCLCVALQ